MKINEEDLTRGQIRKLNALRKSLGEKIADEAFEKWLSQHNLNLESTDPVAEKISNALEVFRNDKSFKLGNKGYIIKRSKGRGASGFVVKRV
ncbi:MAG: hypothetical protein CFH41_00720 [Alphaproteobacteria bacterium MarineAlpha11_Bin1]|nr:MAG: hypothetical protein CFH41_00720 [Alphaproteobacteria bacterium MarineAlpha11_Bin1]|tara:strand:- start:18389 stop:18664 length:276 start_codon:yes stop_codon:yes gene_type:complete